MTTTTKEANKSFSGLNAIMDVKNGEKIKCVTDTVYYGATFQRMADGSFTDLRTALSVPMNNDFLQSKYVLVQEETMKELTMTDAIKTFYEGKTEVFFKLKDGSSGMESMNMFLPEELPEHPLLALAIHLKKSGVVDIPGIAIEELIRDLSTIPVIVLLKASFFVKN